MTYSIKDICERYGVGERTVILWLKSGELKGINVGRTLGKKKPRWRITEQALADFERMRATTPPLPKIRRRRQPAEVIQFYS